MNTCQEAGTSMDDGAHPAKLKTNNDNVLRSGQTRCIKLVVKVKSVPRVPCHLLVYRPSSIKVGSVL